MATKKHGQAIGYIRVSTEEQAVHGISLDAQVERIKAYCTLSGLTLSRIIRDEGVSGAKHLASRGGGRDLIDSLKAGMHVVAIKLDRLFRDAEDALRQTKEWDRGDIVLHLIDLGGATFNTASAMGRFFLSTMAACAELERNLIAERTSTAMGHLKQSFRVYSQVPFGFSSSDGKNLTAATEEQDTVKRLKEWKAEGWTFRRMAEELNTLGIATKRGGKVWYASTIQRILSNQIHSS